MKYFVTAGDNSFYDFISHSASKIQEIYPGKAKLIVYDWGFSTKQRRVLQMVHDNVEVIKWVYYESPFTFPLPNRHLREWLLAQKPYCMRDFMTRYSAQRFVFLDGDAYIIQNVDELFDEDFRIAVTLRREGERDFSHNSCRVVNSGVIAVNDPVIIDKWIERMKRTNEKLVEQTALTRLIYEDNVIKSGVRELSCEQYNYYWIHRKLPSDVKIVHFKGKKIKQVKESVWPETI